MKILIDVNHPGHVHLFKNFSFLALNKNREILFTAKDKEVTINLLEAYGLPYKNLGKHYKGTLGKIYSLLIHVWRLFLISLKFQPDYYLSHGSVPAAWVSFLLRKKYIAFEDTGNMEQIRLYKPFADAILTTVSFKKDFGKVHIRYNGYHEIAYLHPKYFKANPDIFQFLKIKENETYFILRFVSWSASHDVGQGGLSLQDKRDIVKTLLPYGKVFISSEAELPEDLKALQIQIPPEKMHDALAYAQMFVGEGATMASECAVLGTPAVYINSMIAETITEQQNYGLLFHFTQTEGVIEKIKELLNTENLKQKWAERRDKMLSEKIDVTSFLTQFVENFPDSMNIKEY